MGAPEFKRQTSFTTVCEDSSSMGRFISNNLEIIVSACVFGFVAFFAASQRAGAFGERSVGGSTLLAILAGAYVGYLFKCFRAGKNDAVSAD